MTHQSESASGLWLETPDDLDAWLAGNTGPLALDTEFERVSTFFPIPGLVQLGVGEDLRLVEPSVAEQSRGFRAAVVDADRAKLLYAMSEDLDLFRHWLELEPVGFLDLQIGAALAGLGFSAGYARMVEQVFDVSLDKSATRSDWLARPLSEAQLHYALDDIRFLEPLYRHVETILEERALSHAWREECQRVADELRAQAEPTQYYRRIRGGWQLSAEQQNILRELAIWREGECRLRDRPRNRILPDKVLIEIAGQEPKNRQALSRIDGIPPVVVRRYGETILGLVANAGRTPLAAPPIAGPLDRQDQQRFKQLKNVIRHEADSRDIPIELVAPRRHLEACLNGHDGGSLPSFLTQGWRGELLAPCTNDIRDIIES
ncbi:ribonuclease D [Tamilnaduibacter salinus]|uniref:Ribonuclease D n=1 Tax=Tamilnaduibacter salinus TaxID=1484056 RepID=A0A2A2I4T4_9GAMM|nr:HRDC domain-containing protein [Tamilnaduibacter salinus]PAV27021.1 ribonuclease D [Tamilnaduibacter salinus]